MTAFAVALLAWASSALIWPGLLQRSNVPTHMLSGGSWLFDALLWSVLGLATGVRWFAVPMTVAAWHEAWGWAGGLVAGGGMVGLAAIMNQISQWEPRSCAAPLRDETVLLGIAALGVAGAGVGAGVPLVPDLAGAALGGLAVTLVAVGGLVWAFVATWGTAPQFVVMRRPSFRVLGDNPDASTVIARVRITPGRPLRVHLPRVAEGPVTFAVYDGRLRALEKVGWDALQEPLEAKGAVSVDLGVYSSLDADFAVGLEPGRYLLSIRNYRPFDRTTLPRIEEIP